MYKESLWVHCGPLPSTAVHCHLLPSTAGGLPHVEAWVCWMGVGLHMPQTLPLSSLVAVPTGRPRPCCSTAAC